MISCNSEPYTLKRAVYLERGKYGSERGLCKPVTEM